MSTPLDKVFRDLLSCIFDRWAGLQIAVREEFGGQHSKQKAEFLVEVVCEFFRLNKNYDQSDLEDYVAEYLDNEFNWVMDSQNDGSDLSVMCSEICRCFSQCQQGHGEEILAKYKSLPCPAAVQCQRVANNEDSESDSDADESIVSPFVTKPVQLVSSADAIAKSSVVAPAEDSVMSQPGAFDDYNDPNYGGPAPMDEDVEDGWTVVKRGKRL